MRYNNGAVGAHVTGFGETIRRDRSSKLRPVSPRTVDPCASAQDSIISFIFLGVETPLRGLFYQEVGVSNISLVTQTAIGYIENTLSIGLF